MATRLDESSCPYAPMFCTGAAPAEPGIPESASMPAQPRATACATRSSHGSPACTRSRTRPGPVASSGPVAWIPRVTMRITVPSKPSSLARMFEPPPSSSQSSSPAHTPRTASTSSCSVVGAIICAGTPPTRRVVSSARATGSVISWRSVEADARLRLAENGLLVERDGEVDPGDAGIRVDGANPRDDRDDGAVGRVDWDRPGEANLVVDDARGVAGPVDHRLHGKAHGQHAVGEHARQADGGRDVVTVVDGVEISGCPGVAHEGIARQREAPARDDLADLQPVELGGTGCG